jgi:hypothetical protein
MRKKLELPLGHITGALAARPKEQAQGPLGRFASQSRRKRVSRQHRSPCSAWHCSRRRSRFSRLAPINKSHRRRLLWRDGASTGFRPRTALSHSGHRDEVRALAPQGEEGSATRVKMPRKACASAQSNPTPSGCPRPSAPRRRRRRLSRHTHGSCRQRSLLRRILDGLARAAPWMLP